MSTVLRKIEEALHPEQRQYREARAAAQANAPPGQVVLNPQSNNQGGGGAGFGPGAGAGAANNYSHAGGATLAHPQAHHHNDGIQQQDAYAAGPNAGIGAGSLPGPAPNTAGPHRHDFMNKLDPNVDETGGVGRGGGGHQGFGPGAGAAAGAGVGAGAGAVAMHHHDQANHNHHHHQHQQQQQQQDRFCEHCGARRQGGAGYGAGAGTAGAVAGQGFSHGGQGGGAYEGNLPGPAPNTAGPHRSDMLNKFDPSVDSNPGGNSSGAYAGGNNSGVGNNQYGANECQECGRGHDHNRHHGHHGLGPAAAGVAGGVAADRAVEHHRHNDHNNHHGHHSHHGQGAYEEGGIGNDRNNQGGLFGRHGHHDGAGAGVGAGAGAAGAGLAAREFEGGRGNHHHHHNNNNNGPAADYNGNANSANTAGIDLPGPAPNTAGPHRHDFMNKLDPSVDSSGQKYEGVAAGEYAANESGAGRGAEHGVYGQHGDMRVDNPGQTGETMTRDNNDGGRHRGGFGELSRQEAHMNRHGDNQQQGGPFATSAIQPGANQGGGAVYR